MRNTGPKEQKVPLKVSDDWLMGLQDIFSAEEVEGVGSGAGKEHTRTLWYSPSSGALSRGQETAPQFL